MLHTKKKFSEIAGVSLQYLNSYINRKRVICTGKKIDDQLPQNEYFLQTRKKNKVRPPLIFPDLFDFLNLLEGEKEIDYNFKAEKKMVDIIIEADKEKKTFKMIPVSLALSLYADHIRESFDFFFNREIEILKQSGIEPTQEQIRERIEFYTGLCLERIKECRKDFNEVVQLIIEDYTE
jgi:hypothetical protein